MVHVVVPEGAVAVPSFAYANRSDVTSVAIPDSVKSIGHYAFADCSKLAEVHLPDAVESIGDGAFLSCTSMVRVDFPAALVSIGKDSFFDCTGVVDLRLPAALRSIGDGAFGGCSGIADLQLPASLRHVGYSAFSQCRGLARLRLPEHLESIGSGAFAFTRITSLILPAGLRAIGEGDADGGDPNTSPLGAFKWCGRLAHVLAPDALVRGEMADPAKAFSHCPVLKTGLTPLSSVKLPRRTYWHPTMHHWCAPAAKLSVAAVLASELRTARQHPRRLPHLPHELWLLILEFVSREELEPPLPPP